MGKYIVDFELAGDIEVEAKTKEAAIETVEGMNNDELIEHILNCKAGRHYADKLNTGRHNEQNTI